MTIQTVRNVAFRFRVWIFAALYLAGFLTPWQRPFLPRSFLHLGSDTLWLAASTLLARTGWIGLEASTVAVTLAALGCCFAGAALRVWGTAGLPRPATRDAALSSGWMAGLSRRPSRRLWNPLSLGSLLLAAGVAILMPPTGALVFFAGSCLFEWLLISREEALLSVGPGDTCQGHIHPSAPHWLKAALAEIYPVGFALCFAIFAWRYDALILIKCLIVCCGLSLIVRALWPTSSPAATTVSM